MKLSGLELYCPRCGKKLSDRLEGCFQFHCHRCKSQIAGESRQFNVSEGFAVTVISAAPAEADDTAAPTEFPA